MITSILFVGIGALLILAGTGLVIGGLKSTRWPVAVGTVVSSKVTETLTHTGIDCRLFIEYEYSVGGRSYKSHNIVYGTRAIFSSAEEAEKAGDSQ